MNMKKRNKQNAFATIFSAMLATVVAIALVSCDNDLDVQQGYPFTVETMPVPKRIVKGETVEIRCELKREGRFSDARYTVRYFQPDGKGSLRMDDGMVLLPNDRYPLDREVFRLYYTSECETNRVLTYISRTTVPLHNYSCLVLISTTRKRMTRKMIREEPAEFPEPVGNL